MLQSATVQLPRPLFERLKWVAKRQNRSIPDTMEMLITRAEPLQHDLDHDLDVFSELPDDILLLLVDTVWTQTQAARMAELNDKVQRAGQLTEAELAEQEKLGYTYEQGVLRRTEAIEILHRRGYDLSELLQRTYS